MEEELIIIDDRFLLKKSTIKQEWHNFHLMDLKSKQLKVFSIGYSTKQNRFATGNQFKSLQEIHPDIIPLLEERIWSCLK